jgi:hypothetical protein
VCRGSAGQCDVAENCTGSSGTCPADAKSYGFNGFFQPVDNLPAYNVGKAGRTFPIKWQLPIGTSGFCSDVGEVLYNPLRYRQIACNGTSPQDLLETETSGASMLRYDSTSNQYIYNWQTQSVFANNCYELLLELKDGTTQVARFKFTK